MLAPWHGALPGACVTRPPLKPKPTARASKPGCHFGSRATLSFDLGTTSTFATRHTRTRATALSDSAAVADSNAPTCIGDLAFEPHRCRDAPTPALPFLPFLYLEVGHRVRSRPVTTKPPAPQGALGASPEVADAPPGGRVLRRPHQTALNPARRLPTDTDVQLTPLCLEALT